MTTYQGKVEEVSIYPLKTEVVVDAAQGAMVLFIEDVSFLNDGGGALTVDGLADKVFYTGYDEELRSLALASPLPAAVADETELYQFPYGAEKMATVKSEDGGDSVTVLIPNSLQKALDEGVRMESEQETLIYEIDSDGEYIAVEIVAKDFEIEAIAVLPEEVQEQIDALDAELADLNNNVLPQLNTDLNNTNIQLNNILPITETKIADGAVVTNKIYAGAVNTFKMTANDINGDRIKTNTLHADKITVNTIYADLIVAEALTAKHTIRGSKIVGAQIMTAEATTSNRMLMRADGSGGIIEGFMGNTTSNGYNESHPAQINPMWDSANLAPALQLRSPRVNNQNAAIMYLYGASGITPSAGFNCRLTVPSLYSQGLIDTSGGVNASGGIYAGGGLNADELRARSGGLTIAGGGLDMQGAAVLRSGGINIQNGYGISATSLITTTGSVTATGGSVQAQGGLFDLSAANGNSNTLIFGAAGRVVRGSTSKRAYKFGIEDLTDEEAYSILGVKSRKYHPREDLLKTNPRTHVGFIFEEAREAGADLWTWEDPDGVGGMHYDRVAVAHNRILRDLVEDIDRLKRRLAAVEGKLAA